MAIALHLVPPRTASSNQGLALRRLETLSELRAVLRHTLIVRHKLHQAAPCTVLALLSNAHGHLGTSWTVDCTVVSARVRLNSFTALTCAFSASQVGLSAAAFRSSPETDLTSWSRRMTAAAARRRACGW